MLKEFLQIKKIIALLLTIVFCYLAIVNKVTSEQYLTVFSLVIAFYFGQSTARQAVKETTATNPEVPKVIDPVNITNDMK
ncbi:hypothetical protein [Clostridium magnum]|uniref:Uncharacterized protein n=1 Tax=Clostridium magnum DSM 2767 TaxID=1121326 RepID=A0A162UXC7_9CLOT|nr:hypothetical protein CLMAG_14340 [Clostridium magnum DSM 2767]SHJ59647.1 hypothetical protein SAMN02745944_06209 [Clostridium magnum DSM 2767]